MDRHRQTAIWIAIGLAIAIPLIALATVLITRKWSNKSSKEEAFDIAILLALGGIGFIMDWFVDGWFYGLFLAEYVLLFHLFVLGVWMAGCVKMKVSLKWTSPIIFEMIMILVCGWLLGPSWFYIVAFIFEGFVIAFTMLVFRKIIHVKHSDLEELDKFTEGQWK